MALNLSSCAHNGPITPGEICVEIPFIDAPEGACVHTVNRKASLVSAEKWKERRKTMLMIDSKYWTEIKKDWLKACRYAGPQCNVMVDSIEQIIRSMDAVAKKLIPLPNKN